MATKWTTGHAEALRYIHRTSWKHGYSQTSDAKAAEVLEVSERTWQRWLLDLREGGYVKVETEAFGVGNEWKSRRHITPTEQGRAGIGAEVVAHQGREVARSWRTRKATVAARVRDMVTWFLRDGRPWTVTIEELANRVHAKPESVRSAVSRWEAGDHGVVVTRCSTKARVYVFAPAAVGKEAPAPIPVVEVQAQAAQQQEVTEEQQYAADRAWLLEDAGGSMDTLHAYALEDDHWRTVIRREEAGEPDPEWHGSAGMGTILLPQLIDAEEEENQRRSAWAQTLMRAIEKSHKRECDRDAEEKARRQQLAEERQRQNDWAVSLELERRGMKHRSVHAPQYPRPIEPYERDAFEDLDAA